MVAWSSRGDWTTNTIVWRAIGLDPCICRAGLLTNIPSTHQHKAETKGEAKGMSLGEEKISILQKSPHYLLFTQYTCTCNRKFWRKLNSMIHSCCVSRPPVNSLYMAHASPYLLFLSFRHSLCRGALSIQLEMSDGRWLKNCCQTDTDLNCFYTSGVGKSHIGLLFSSTVLFSSST